MAYSPSTGVAGIVTRETIFDSRDVMPSDEILDQVTVRRIEREHDTDVIDEAYEIHVADYASTSLMQVLAALPHGTPVAVHLRNGEALRGNLQDPVEDWVSMECSGRRILVAHRAIARTQVSATVQPAKVPNGQCSISSVSSVSSVLREHQRAAGMVRLRLVDATGVSAHIVAVGADFLALTDAFLVPLGSVDVCELL